MFAPLAQWVGEKVGMKFELTVCYGERKGTRFRLAPKITNIGRSSAADVVIDWDPFVSPLHCRIELRDDGVVVSDLGSSNGTRINDVRVMAPTKVGTQDDIQVGFTVLRLEPVAEVAEINSSIAPVPAVTTLSSIAPEQSSSAEETVPVKEVERTPSLPVSKYDPNVKQTFYASDDVLLNREDVEYAALFDDKVRISGVVDEERGPGQVLATFAHAFPEPLFIVDFSRLKDAPRPSSDPSQCILFHWLSNDTALQLPCLYALSELPNWKGLLQDYWGQDGILVLVSQYTKAKMLEQLRKRLRYDVELPAAISEKSDKDAGYGYCWPSVLMPLIEMNVEGFGREFLADLEFVFSENPVDPSGWLILGPKKLLAKVAGVE